MNMKSFSNKRVAYAKCLEIRSTENFRYFNVYFAFKEPYVTFC